MARLTREWEELSQQEQTTRIQHDVGRAETLARYVAAGLTPQEMAAGLQLSTTYLGNLLRYYRFISSREDMDITEGRFRKYWQQISDPRTYKSYNKHPEKKEVYEQTVFQAIAEKIKAGEAPRKPIQKRKQTTPEQLRANVEWATATKKEVEQIYRQELQPVLRRLQGLLRADRATYSPSGLAGAARVLDRGLNHILRLLTELQDEDIVSLTQEPHWQYTGQGTRVARLGRKDKV